MAIKCSAETTVTNQIDATDLIMWYYATTLTTKPLSPSTTSASVTPTGWSLIEPTIASASDLSKYIYECLQIVWGDGTCSWGDVQLSASFEAAKQAYNLAHSTASIFTTFEQTHNKTLVDTVNESSSAITTLTESHQYGGINLLSNTKSIDSSSAPYTNSNISLYSNQAPIDGESFYYCSGPKYFQIDFPTLINNQKYTLSFDISRSSDSRPVFVKIDETETNIGTAVATTWTRLSHTFTANASTTNAQIRVAFDSTSSTATYIAAIRHIKLEQGSLATPWEYSSNDISTLSNTVNTVSQTADSNSSTISNLTQTLGTNANGTTKTDDIVHQVSDINQDLNGITTRVGKTEIALKGNYAVSSTAKGTANKQATISPALANYELVKGAAITVKFTTENTAANPTLNINSTGAKPIKTYSGAALSESEYKWDAGSTMTFVYDGTNWCIQDSTELTRIKSNETLINQTANNVLIKATESDTTAAQGGQHLIQSLINVAPNGIKISADKVDIEGAAIFSENGYLSQDNINAINNESQTIYIQAVSGTSSVLGTTTWVTNTGESVTQDAANLTPVWTIKRPIYRTNYPVLFVATQYKTIDGTVTCTTPLKDDTITVIDAGHITTGTIDASNITVTNLNADNITTGTINGQRIGAGSLSLDKLAEDIYTETEVNNIVDNLQTQIDGAIETWTGTNIPTLNNTPASAWTTDSIKDTHVGDVYFIVNDQSQQNGYNYRFTKTTSNGTSTYSWQLIKDNDVTNALQRLTTAEGKIGNIETFDSTVSSYMTNTDNEITSIKSAATTLAGRVDTAEGTLQTKVDTTTFNTLSQTVNGHSSSISQLTTETTTLTQAVDTLNTKTSSDNGNIVQFSDSIGFKEIVVHGKSKQANYVGINIWDEEIEDGLYNSTTGAKATGDTYLRSKNVIPVVPGNTYYCKRPSNVTLYTYTYGSDMSYVPGGISVPANGTFTVPEGIYYFAFAMQKSQYGNIYKNDVCINVNDPAINGIYESYTGGKPSPSPDYPQEIKSVNEIILNIADKNLFDISKWELDSNSGISINEDGISLRVAQQSYQELKNRYYLPGRANFIFSFDYEVIDAGTGQGVFWLHSYNENSYRVTSIRLDATTAGVIKHISGTIPNDVIYLSFGGWSYSAIVRVFNIQLELSDNVTDYEPYQGQSIDIPLGNYQVRSLPDGTEDTLTFSYIGPSIREGWGLYNVELVQNTDIRTLNGTESWNRGGSSYDGTNGTDRFININTMINPSVQRYNSILANKVKGGVNAAIWASPNSHIWEIVHNGTQCHIVFDNETIGIDVSTDTETQRTSKIKEWLTENPIDVLYPLVEPVTHDLGTIELPLSENLNLWASTSPSTTVDATWWHEAGRAEKNTIDVSNAKNNISNTIDSITLEAPYQEVEWVESDGRAFVMLDWKPNPDNWGFEIDFSTIDKFNSGHGTGALDKKHTSSTDYAGSIFGTCNVATSSNDYRLGTYDYSDGVLRSGNNNKYHGKLYSDGRRQQCSLRGNTYIGADGSITTITRNGAAPKWNMVIFGNTQSGSSLWCTNPCSARIYSLKFYDGDTLAVDLVGAYRKSDGCTGFWDKVKKHFYPAAGMTYGSVVNDIGEIPTILSKILNISPQLVTNNIAATRLWTADTNEISELVDGQQIVLRNRFGTATEAQTSELAYYLDSGSSNNVYLKLTLSDNTETDWIPCYYSNTGRLTTHYGAGSEIRLVYRENVVSGTSALIRGWWADANYDSNTNDNARYIQWYNNVLAKAAIRNASIICGDDSGYQEIGNNVTFDLSYPLLWRTAALAINKTDYQYSYTLTYDRTLATCYPSISGIKNQILYLVGEPSGGEFTIKSPVLTFDVPTEADDLYYIPIGKLGNQSTGQNYLIFSTAPNPTMFAYIGDAFQQVQGLVVRTANSLNETIDTVSEHTRKIGTLETTIETKADSSTVTTVSNRLNTVSDTVDGHTQSITSLNTTVATKADSSTVSALQTQTNTISNTVDGHTQSISSINSTMATKADGSTVTTLSNQVNNISDTVDGHTSSISSLNTTVATKADSSTVTTLSNDYATFKQQVTGFESTVGETYATKTEVSDLSDELDSRTSTLGYSVIVSSDVTDLTVANPSATLTAKVYKDGEELTSADIALIGSVKWYKGSTLVGTGLTLSANQKARYIARLEATINE